MAMCFTNTVLSSSFPRRRESQANLTPYECRALDPRLRGDDKNIKKRKIIMAKQSVTVGGVEVPKLKSYIERIERLDEDKAGIASDIRDVFAEAKSNGFDVKAMRQVLKLRKMKANERTEAEYMLDLYKRALGLDIELDEEEAA